MKPFIYLYRLLDTLWHKPYAIREFFLHLRKKGLAVTLKETLYFLEHKAHKRRYNYQANFDLGKIKQEIDSFTIHNCISIILPVYDINIKWLSKCIESVQKQLYENWQLCITDDASTNPETLDFLKSLKSDRIKITFHKENQGIVSASNSAANMATGDYLLFLDHDDELSHDCLFEFAKNINATQADIIYSDEDFIDTNGQYHSPHFKPDYSPQLLLAHNYITHAVAIKRQLFIQVGGFRDGFDGAQDYDLLLRACEQANHVEHIAKVLYHWRNIPQSTSMNPGSKSYADTSGIKALQETVSRRKLNAEVLKTDTMFFYRIKYKLQATPLISIVIPVKDQASLLRTCIDSILTKTTYSNYEIQIINNNSEQQETLDLFNQLTSEHSNIFIHDFEHPFNFSAINNFAVNKATGTQVVLLNNDTEVISPDWLESLLEHSQRPEVGAVGAKFYYKNNTIQHAGIAVGIGETAGHLFKHLPAKTSGYFNLPNLVREVSAVTAACLMVKKALYLEIGGLNEKDFAIAFNDVDFCLRLREKGYTNIFTPFCELYHDESVSRGYEDTPEKIARFNDEADYLRQSYTFYFSNGDPFYNPNFSMKNGLFEL